MNVSKMNLGGFMFDADDPGDEDVRHEAIKLFMRQLEADFREATVLEMSECRHLVVTYYAIQKARVAVSNRLTAARKAGTPSGYTRMLYDELKIPEVHAKHILERFVQRQPFSAWAQDIYGIGPVITAGLIAYIDITRATSVSSLWRYAGLDPTADQYWKLPKGARRPWVPTMRTIAWKAAQSFMKVQSNPKDFYGKFYRRWKDGLVEQNEAGKFADEAAHILQTKNITKPDVIKRLKSGRLTDGHIDARALRRVAKLFLSHVWVVMHELHYGVGTASKPWVIEHGGHEDYVPAPNWPHKKALEMQAALQQESPDESDVAA